MSNPRFVCVAFAASLLFVACGGTQEAVQMDPAPTGPTPEEIAEQQRIRDSIAAHEEMMRQRAETDRMEREAERRAAAARATVTETVYFDYDESAIRMDTQSMLRAKLDILRANPGLQLRMEGHADERGTSEYNIALGNERARSVIEFFTGFGLGADRFTSVSYGEEQPAMQGSNEDAWSLNRRVEFVITAGGNTIVGD